MRGKWVDNPDYFGTDRRRVGAGRLWKERRRFDEATPEAPALAAMLRRLRVQVLGFSTPEERKYVLQLANAALLQAESQRNLACADVIRDVVRAILRAPQNNAQFRADVDTRLIDALALAAPR